MTNIILFGPPGVGKSTIGKLMADKFDFIFFDGDEVMTNDDRVALSSGQWDDGRRQGVLRRIAERFNALNSEGVQNVVTSVALTMSWMRDELVRQISYGAVFVLVRSELSDEKIVELVSTRSKEGHPINVENFRKFTAAFEAPSMKHKVLINPGNGIDNPNLENNVREITEAIGL